MHIGFRTSGGRGEYEVVGSHTGYTAMNLEGWTFQVAWPDGIVRDTGLWLDPAGSGKPRLRSLRDKPFQIGRQMAAMLLLPDPRRQYVDTLSGLPVARRKGYVLTRLGFGYGSEFTGVTDVVTIDPTFVDLDNLTDNESIGIRHRWARIEAVYRSADLLPADIRSLIMQHRTYMANGLPIDEPLASIVHSIQKALEPAVPNWQAETDPLTALESLLNITPPIGPSLPPPDEIGEEEPEVSVRSAHEYRLAKIRGASGRKFSVAVQSAYRGRCAFCGGAYGGKTPIRAGIDAAHILAWSKYDLDVVPNGIGLCKLHHWAFDAGLLLPVYQAKVLTLRFTELATEHLPSDTLARLGLHDWPIWPEWMPQSRDDWPSKSYLDRLYADLGVTFAASVQYVKPLHDPRFT